jgi:hypothetical protein
LGLVETVYRLPIPHIVQTLMAECLCAFPTQGSPIIFSLNLFLFLCFFYRERMCFLFPSSPFFFGSLRLSAFLCWLGDVLRRLTEREPRLRGISKLRTVVHYGNSQGIITACGRFSPAVLGHSRVIVFEFRCKILHTA